MARPTTRRRSSAETREHILDVSYQQFYWHGIHAVGVDKIAAEAGVAPITLYRLFRSKDDLVGAYLERTSAAYREWFLQATGTEGASPQERILSLFDALIEQVQPDNCRGCPFLMALGELPDNASPGHQHAVALKKWVYDRLAELVGELAETAPVSDAEALTDHLMLLMEGVYASVLAVGVDGPARSTRRIAETLLPPGR